ncbi:MAG TPA: polyribonucleotide nucleotidyltransferase [Terriglobales bacterium]
MPSRVSVELAGGKTLTLETGKIARQAGGAVIVRLADTMVLATATSADQPREGIDFFPLTVDYREYTYASGRFPGGYIKREGRPTEKEVLTSRQIDRPVRPLFAKGFRNETQVIALVLSADQDNDPDVLAVTGAGAALHVSDVPFPHPLAGVRVAYVDGNYICNPTYAEMRQSQLNIVVAGTAQGIAMVEAGATVVSEEIVVGAIEFGHEQIKKIIVGIEQLRKEAGAPKRVVEAPKVDEAFYQQIFQKYGTRMMDALDTKVHPKLESQKLEKAIELEAIAAIPAGDTQAELKSKTKKYFERMRERLFRENLLLKRQRPDGRAFDQIRQVTCEVGLLPRTHGSALFTRGETQALVTVTLGTKEDQQRIETIEGEGFKRFMLNYNFPPFSVGETGFLRGPGRREIGHGALAERSQLSQLPPDGTFNYTIRVVSDIMESNGSSSMASVCGASLALADAGVPMQAPVAGIAMGLVKEDEKYAILTDIAGAEDHYGDMDFKVAGTREGITALQMDIKITGVDAKLMREALEQARKARLFLLDKMAETIAAPRTTRSLFAPQITTIKIPVDKIRDLIGPGGKMIRSIVEATGAKIDVSDDGTVNIAAVDGNAGQKALQMVSDVTASAEIGKTYLGKVVRLVDFGAFVEIFPGTDGLLHISEIAEYRVRAVEDELKEGDQILVRCINIEGNKVKLSRKSVLKEQREKLGLPLPPPPPGSEAGEGDDRPPRREHSDDDRPRGRGGFRGGRGGRDRR